MNVLDGDFVGIGGSVGGDVREGSGRMVRVAVGGRGGAGGVGVNVK